MKRTTWLALAGIFTATVLGSCRKPSEPSEIPEAPVAKVDQPEIKTPEVIDLTPPPAVPPAADAVPADVDPSAPDTEVVSD